MGKRDSNSKGKPFYRHLTVADIQGPKGAEYVEVLFLESARIYRLLKKKPGYDHMLRQLRDAMAKKRVAKVRFASPDSDVIEEVQVG